MRTLNKHVKPSEDAIGKPRDGGFWFSHVKLLSTNSDTVFHETSTDTADDMIVL